VNAVREASHRGLVAATLLIVGLSCPAIGASAAGSPTPGDSVGLRLVDAPADRAQDPRAHIYIVDHLAPGTTILRRVEVSNGTAQAMHIRLYAGAAALEQGQFKAPGGPGGNELAGWTSVSPPAVDVPPGGTMQATVTIRVPSSASSGERYGVVWAELPASQANGGVSLVNLTGVRIYLSVGPGGEPASGFVIQSLVARRDQQGHPVVAAQVRNTGGRALDLAGRASLSGGPGRLSAGPFDAKNETLPIGQSGDVLVPLDPAIPSGSWKVQVTLHSGLVENTAEALLEVPATSEPAQARVRARPVKSAPHSLTLIAGVVLLGAVSLGLAGAARRRRRQRQSLPPRAGQPLAGQRARAAVR
jgi:hypothetical protein